MEKCNGLQLNIVENDAIEKQLLMKMVQMMKLNLNV